MRFTVLCLALVAIAMSATAQKFVPGYYIKLSGDTIKKDLALQLKKDLIDKVITPEGLFLAPKDLLGFGLNNLNYVVRKVSLDKTPDGGFVTDTVFLEVMNRGKISLFYMIDENDKAHFYIENENGPQELTVRLNSQNDGIVVRKVETYKSALKGIFPACTDVFPAIDKTVFSRRGIQSVYEKLYKCRFQEEAPVMKKEESIRITHLGIFGGVSTVNQSLALINNNPPSIVAVASGMKFNHSVRPTGGIYLEVKFDRKRTLALRQELSFLQYEQKSNPRKIDPYSSVTYTGTIGASYIKYTAAIRGYLLPGRKVRPFISAGVSPMIVVSKANEMKKEDSYNSTTTFEPIFKTNIHNATVGYFIGVGVVYDKFGLEFRRDVFRGYSNILLWTVFNYTATLHYTIKSFGPK